MQHVLWHQDILDPFFTPNPGEYIFRDGTEADATEMCKKILEQYHQYKPDDADMTLQKIRSMYDADFQPGFPVLHLVV